MLRAVRFAPTRGANETVRLGRSGRRAGRGKLEAPKMERRRDDAAHQGPGAQTRCRLPGTGRNDALKYLAVFGRRTEPDPFWTSALIANFKERRGTGLPESRFPQRRHGASGSARPLQEGTELSSLRPGRRLRARRATARDNGRPQDEAAIRVRRVRGLWERRVAEIRKWMSHGIGDGMGLSLLIKAERRACKESPKLVRPPSKAATRT